MTQEYRVKRAYQLRRGDFLIKCGSHIGDMQVFGKEVLVSFKGDRKISLKFDEQVFVDPNLTNTAK